MAADTKISEGAREERRAFRVYLRRRAIALKDAGLMGLAAEVEETLKWVMQRQSRYDKAPGGLGRS